MLSTAKIRTIIIEDNLESQDYLQTLLSQHFSSIEIIGFAPSISKAVPLITSKKPELIFMDIELTDGSSFEIFDQLSNHEFEVIFITAFKNHIQKAIDHFAFNFIIKPYTKEKLIEVVNRYISLKERLFSIHKYHSFSNFINNSNMRFLLHVGNEHISIKVNDVVKCIADGNYTQFHIEDGTVHLASNNLKYYEELLVKKRFFKANRSCLVNLEFIQSIYKKEAIKLTNGESIIISTRNKSNVSALINALS